MDIRIVIVAFVAALVGAAISALIVSRRRDPQVVALQAAFADVSRVIWIGA